MAGSWPGGRAHEVKDADVTTPGGVKTQTFDLSHESPCGAKLCTGGGVGINSSGSVTGRAGGGASFGGRDTVTGHGAQVEGFGVSR